MSVAWAAFEQLYKRRVQEVHDTIYAHLCKRYFPDRDLAWQLTQETFVQAWDSLPKKTTQSPFVPWMKRVGINEARQYLRKMGRETTLTEEQNPFLNPSESSPEEQIEQTALRERIERVKARLTRRQLTVFILHYEEGLSLQEIAQRLNLQPATIWQALYRANGRFRYEWLKEGASSTVPLPALKPKSGGTHGAPDQS